jgi:hypothetical protein
MKPLVLSAVVWALAFAGTAGSAHAQVRTEPPGKLFFEGDVVNHRLEGQRGPFCVLQSQFVRGEAIAWRVRVLQANGTEATDKQLKSLEVQLGNGTKIPLTYGPHGNPPTDFFWAESWTVPQNYPTGSLGYKVLATMMDGTVVTWQPFTRPASQLTIIEGQPQMETASN